jgi:hypothetical protein
MMRDRGLRYWLPTYLRDIGRRRAARAARKRALTHILFLICDHFEPRHGIEDEQQPAERLRAWHEGYRELQAECRRRFGLAPVHTWFYPPHHGFAHLPELARMAFDGLGEVELHYHHEGDTKETLRATLRGVLERYHRAGLLLQQGAPPGARFGFIHGDWALDNSAGGRFCGVNDELSVLANLGCYADLTMPSANACQTRRINSIYYASGDERRAKSHDWGELARVGRPEMGGLMLIQGPLGIGIRGRVRPYMENANLMSENWGDPGRIRAWIDCHVHVRGRPEWLFVKLHTHGAMESNFDALFGLRARRMHATLAERCNDGRIFKLHYITARQAFNVIRAAQHGAAGDPSAYLDWEIPPPVSALYFANAAHDLRACTPARVAMEGLAAETGTVVEFRQGALALTRVTGPFQGLEVGRDEATIKLAPHAGAASVGVQLAAGAAIEALSGASQVREEPGGGWRLTGSQEMRLRLARSPGAAVAAQAAS